MTCEEGVVADLRMSVEGKVVRIEGATAADEGSQSLEDRADERAWLFPVDTVVYDEKIDAFGHGVLEGDKASVDGSADFGD